MPHPISCFENRTKRNDTMTTTYGNLSSNVRPAHLHEAPITASSVIDFIPKHDRLQEQTNETLRQLEIEREVRKAAAQRRRSTELYDPLEDWLYSLIPAAAIVALLIGVLGLLDSQRPEPPTGVEKKAATIEQSRPSQSKDGKF
jgi:hypothetical protein